MDLEEVWRIREEEIYPALFGGVCRGIFPLKPELFRGRFSIADPDPRWIAHGVFEYAPTAARAYWIYVTSGYSNPWDLEPEEYEPGSGSGSGVEFLFASSQRGDWAISFLQNMLAYDLLLAAGHFGDRPTMDIGHRIPLNSAINGAPASLIRNAIVSVAEELPIMFALPSGAVDFLTFTGVTDAEIAVAQIEGTAALIERLRTAGYYPVTDPSRRSIF